MRINRVKKAIIKGSLRFARKKKRSLKLLIVRSKYSKMIGKIAKMPCDKAIFWALKNLLTQIKIRPRIRFLSSLMTILIVSFLLSGTAVAYLKPKEAKIKINGQAVLVADKVKQKDEADFEISQVVNSKRSPFDFKRPVEGGYISQGYSHYHPAIDIATTLGMPIHPLGPGVVEFAGRVSDGKGNIVIINHGDGLKSLYAHLGKITVGTGDGVNPEMIIGTVGLSGRTTGAHIHLEIHDQDKTVDPVGVLSE